MAEVDQLVAAAARLDVEALVVAVAMVAEKLVAAELALLVAAEGMQKGPAVVERDVADACGGEAFDL